MKTYNIVVLPGDGIGPDIIEPSIKVLEKVAQKQGFAVNLVTKLIGGVAIDATGSALPEDTLQAARGADAVLLGAVGGPKWENMDVRPEQGLLKIRAELGLYANLRPAVVYGALKDASPLKPEVLGDKLDILVVRELTGGIYFGDRARQEIGGEMTAYDTERYSVGEIKRIAKIAFDSAMVRGKKVCSVDKANVLESSRLWRETVIEMAKSYPEVDLSHMYVDNAAMQLVRDPNQFDVILTNNIFGDILSDEASQITGSIGMLASASIGSSVGMYEPIHGSAPDIAGKNLANPIATILSVAMMLRYSIAEVSAAEIIEKAVEKVINNGARTADIADKKSDYLGTKEIAELIISAI